MNTNTTAPIITEKLTPAMAYDVFNTAMRAVRESLASAVYKGLSVHAVHAIEVEISDAIHRATFLK